MTTVLITIGAVWFASAVIAAVADSDSRDKEPDRG